MCTDFHSQETIFTISLHFNSVYKASNQAFYSLNTFYDMGITIHLVNLVLMTCEVCNFCKLFIQCYDLNVNEMVLVKA